MPAKSFYLYSDKPSTAKDKRVCSNNFSVSCEECVLLTSTTGLELPIMRRVGTYCPNGDTDFVWKPLIVNGEPVVLSDATCPLLIILPGTYTIGDVPEGTAGIVYAEEVECKPGNFTSPSLTGNVKTVVSTAVIEFYDPVNECCVPVLIEYCSDGSRVVRDIAYLNEILQEIEMGTTLTPYKPQPGADVCAQTQENLYELLAGTYTVQDILDAMIADAGLQFEFDGKTPIPVLAENAQKIDIVAKACGTFDSAGNEITVDYFEVDGNALSAYSDDEEGGVSLDAAIVIPDGACALVNACFKLCVSKQEFAALG